MTTPLEAAQKHHTRCDTIYESFTNGQNSQFMEQIVDYDVNISFLLAFVGNYYGNDSANEVARRYAALAQGELDTLRRTIEDMEAEAEERNGINKQ